MSKKPQNKITLEIKCSNLAPIVNLNEKIESDSLRLAIFADNGSGKTFLSNTFRLLEKSTKTITNKGRKIPTDKFITFGQNKCSIAVKITGKDGKVAEEFNLDINRGIVPTLPPTNYIFHCFNDDYVEENIYNLSCDKDENIEGFILGKINIDLDKEKKELSHKKQDHFKLEEKIKREIENYIAEKIGKIPHISRLNDYKVLTFEEISENIENSFVDSGKSYEELINDYDKLKSIPEHLADIDLIAEIKIENSIIDDIFASLNAEYSLGSFAEDFKQKVKANQEWIEQGLKLVSKNTCPFCEHNFDKTALDLIDQYNEFLKDQESKTIKLFNQYKNKLKESVESLNNASTDINRRIIEYKTYKTEYIPSLQDTDLAELEIEDAVAKFKTLINLSN
jgi:hypothetical protein